MRRITFSLEFIVDSLGFRVNGDFVTLGHTLRVARQLRCCLPADGRSLRADG